jgi:hypothetical protein
MWVAINGRTPGIAQQDTDVDDSEASQLADVKVTFFSIPTPSSISPTTRPFLVR